MQRRITNIYIVMFYRYTRYVIHLKKAVYIKNIPNQTKPMKITKNLNIKMWLYLVLIFPGFLAALHRE